MSPQGHFLVPWLLLSVLLLLLPAAVVSTGPKKQPVNEAIGPAEKGGPAIKDSALIARAERGPEALPDYRELQRRLQRSLRSGGLELFPVALHQQSTNAAAAKRDLHYKQHGRPARGTAANPGMIERGKKYANKKRLSTLAGQINELKSATEIEVDRRIGSRDNFQPARIVYADAAQPEPFVQPSQREPARPFSLTNFLVKNRLLLESRSFRPSSKAKSLKSKSASPTERDVAEKIKQKKASAEASTTTTEMTTTTEVITTAETTTTEMTTTEMTTTELPKATEVSTTVKNNVTEELNKNFALYYQIVDRDLQHDAASNLNLEENSITVETAEDLRLEMPQSNTNSGVETKYRADWDTNEALTREIMKEVAVNEEPKRRRQAAKIRNDAEEPGPRRRDEKYEFGYRVIDQGSGSEFGHAETRQGRMTSGQYHVRLPDGRLQRVSYVVDGVGYHAVVSYERDGTTRPTTTRRPRRRPRRRHT